MGFLSLEIARSSMMSHQTAIDVTGHNISNANTNGYSRQLTTLTSKVMESKKYGTQGIGVEASGVNRIRDTFIDDRIVEENQEKARWKIKEINMRSIQYILNEPSEESLRSTLDKFWTSMQDLSQHPEDSAARTTALERGVDLADTISDRYNQMNGLKDNINENVRIEVEEVNTKLEQIANLNKQITRLEADSKQVNDLRDKRDLLVEKLSDNLSMQISRENEFSIIVGGRTAVQGSTFKQMKTEKNAEGTYSVKWTDLDSDVLITNGQIKGLQELRDVEIPRYTDYLDQLAIGLIDTVNGVHSSGFDLNGLKGGDFFNDFQTNNETKDMNNDGNLNAAIYKMEGTRVIAESQRTPLANEDGIEEVIGSFNINGMEVEYNTAKDSLFDLTEKINDIDTGIVANISAENRLVLRGDKSSQYIIREIGETDGTLLQDLGVLKVGETSFNYEDPAELEKITDLRKSQPRIGAASRISVNITDIDRIAAANGVDTTGDGIADTANNAGDGSNALDLASLKYQKTIGKYTYIDYFQSLIADLGVESQKASRYVENQNIIVEDLEVQRQSKIGVSLDEEMTNLIKFQHGYNAAAKFISTVNSLYDTLINKI